MARDLTPKSSRAWQRSICLIYENKCLVTELGPKEVPLIRHHLWSSHSYPFLTHSLLNGVLIAQSLHVDFHGRFGSDVDANDFSLYLANLAETHLSNIAVTGR